MTWHVDYTTDHEPYVPLTTLSTRAYDEQIGEFEGPGYTLTPTTYTVYEYDSKGVLRETVIHTNANAGKP